MGQTLRKLGSGRSPSRIASSKAQQPPAESRFDDPTLKGHLPGDVHPDRLHPSATLYDQEREWDRSDAVYSTMAKKLAGSVVTKQVQESGGVDERTYARRPLPKIRNTTGTSFDEESAVPPGKLNLGQIRQVFHSYQGLIEGEKPMSVEALAEKYKVDVLLLEKVLRFYAISDKKEEFKSVKSDESSDH